MKTIEKRRSVRTFSKKPIELETRKEIEDFLSDLEKQYPKKYKFPIIDTDIDGKIGTYGVIKHAKTYIGGVLLGDGNLVELGYLFEKIILYLTDLDLGTCWLGGTFKRSEFFDPMGLEDGDRLLILSPVGYIQEKMSFREKSMRAMARSDKRKNFDELFLNDRLETLDLYALGDFKDALEMVRIGPSASNKQPWRVIRVDDDFHFYLKRTKDYAKNLDYDIQMLDMGIAMCHFERALKEKDIRGSFTSLEKFRNYKGLDYITTWTPSED